jgi:hypothetical protein
MKFSVVFVLFNLFYVCCVLTRSRQSNNAVSIAFEEMTKILMKSNRDVLMLNIGENSKVFDEVLLKRQKAQNWLRTVRKLDKTILKEPNPTVIFKSSSGFVESSAAILFIDQVKVLKRFITIVTGVDRFLVKFKLYVYCNEMTMAQLETNLTEANINARRRRIDKNDDDLIKNDMNDYLSNQYFVVNDGRSIKLMTFVWYTPQACHLPQLVEVNRFNKNTKKWKSSEFSIEKCRNFHGCGLVFGIRRSIPEIVFKNFNSSMVFDGYGIKLVKALSETLNFKYQFNPIIDHLYLKKNSKVDLALAFKSNLNDPYTRFLNNYFFVSEIFVEKLEYFAVPPGAPYDAFELISMPFDLQTWIWTLLTFVVAFATIGIVYRMKVEVQNFVFGRNVITPSLNVLAHFFGTSQVMMPQRNFARFLVMSFILLSFMLRNLYQGVMCDYFQTDMRRPQPIQSIRDISKSGYSIYFNNSKDFSINSSPLFHW